MQSKLPPRYDDSVPSRPLGVLAWAALYLVTCALALALWRMLGLVLKGEVF